jgi:hypothetical protein
LKKFFVTVACLHPNLVPNEKVMWAPIPFDARHLQSGFLYRVVINILEVVVVSPGAPPRPQALISTSLVGRRRGHVNLRQARAGPRRLRLALRWGHSLRVLQGWLRCLWCRPLDGTGGLCPPVWRPCGSSAAPTAPPLLSGMGATGHPPVGRRLQQLAGLLIDRRYRSHRFWRVVSGGWSAQVVPPSSAGPPTPHTTGRSAPCSEEVEVRSRVREEPTLPLRLASDIEPSGSSSTPRGSCSPWVDLQVVAQSLGAPTLVGAEGSTPPLPLPSVVAPLR